MNPKSGRRKATLTTCISSQTTQISTHTKNMNPRETNPHLLRQNQISAARKRWQESEWHLNFLRTTGQTKPKPPNDEELLTWNQPTFSIARTN